MVYKIKDGFITRHIGKLIMAVPVGRLSGEIPGMISLTESGELLWNILSREQGADEETLVSALLEAYDTDEETAKKEVAEFIQMLSSMKALV